MSRSVAEWIGRTDDSKVPPKVRLRIFNRENGVCYLSGVKIVAGQAWELEHKIPLASKPGLVSGLHREFNLFPALVAPHKEKTAREATERAKSDRMAMANLGIRAPSKMQSRPFQPSAKQARREERRKLAGAIVRRPMFMEDCA